MPAFVLVTSSWHGDLKAHEHLVSVAVGTGLAVNDGSQDVQVERMGIIDDSCASVKLASYQGDGHGIRYTLLGA